MRKSWSLCLAGTFAAMLFGSGMTFADEAPISGGLTPRRAVRQQNVVLAQQPENSIEQVTVTVPAPPQAREPQPISVAAANPQAANPQAADAAFNSAVFTEIEQLRADIQKLQNDTKKPDTKKGWSTPKINGRLFLDSYTVNQEPDRQVSDLKNKGGIREMQFSIAGNGFDSFDYKLELSLAPDGGRVNLVDNWIGVKNLPLLGYVRAGHFKPETGLAYPTSALHTTLSEFIAPSGTFGFGRRFGVASEHLFARDRIRLFSGFFQGGQTNTNRFVQLDDQGQVFNARLSAAPYFAEGGRYVLHFGSHYSYVSSQGTNQQSLGLQAGGGNAWFGDVLTTGTFASNNHHRAGAEVAYQAGPFSVQSEAYVAKYAAYGTSTEDKTASGAYVELKYFLTGEHRAYNLASGTFGAAKVKHNFHPFRCGEFNLIDGFGAWQAVVQYSYLDLTDWRTVNTNAGRENDLTFGLNWFWTPNIRWIFEYTHSQREIGATHDYRYEDIFGTSLRLNF
ncbi:porin [Planctomycetales bacterium]|nr:porin [Planctomycetales bacterium]